MPSYNDIKNSIQVTGFSLTPSRLVISYNYAGANYHMIEAAPQAIAGLLESAGYESELEVEDGHLLVYFSVKDERDSVLPWHQYIAEIGLTKEDALNIAAAHEVKKCTQGFYQHMMSLPGFVEQNFQPIGG